MNTITKSIHELYMGPEDIMIKNLPEKKYFSYNSIICKKEIKLNSNISKSVIIENPINYNNQNNQNNQDNQDNQNYLGIANIQITGEWDSVKFLIEGQIFDCNYRKLNTFEMFKNGNCVPFVKYMNFSFSSNSADCVITYSIVKMGKIPFKFTFLLDTTQEDKIEVNKTGLNAYNLVFNHPAKKLIILNENPISDVKFIDLDNNYILPFTQINENNWELDFGDTTVNLSRMSKPIILYKSSTENLLNIYVRSLNIAIMCNNLYGVAFSK